METGKIEVVEMISSLKLSCLMKVQELRVPHQIAET